MRLYKKLFLIIILFILIVTMGEFISSNNVEMPIKFFNYSTNPLPLYLIIFLSFVIGLLIIIIFMFLGITRQEFKIIRQSRTIRKLQEKLHKQEKDEKIIQ